MPEPSTPSASTASHTFAAGIVAGSWVRPKGAIRTAAQASWPSDTCSGGIPRTVTARVQHRDRVAEGDADHRQRGDEVAAALDADEQGDADEPDPDADQPHPGDALAGVHPRGEDDGEDRGRRLDHRGEPRVEAGLGEAEQPERHGVVERAEDDDRHEVAPERRRGRPCPGEARAGAALRRRGVRAATTDGSSASTPSLMNRNDAPQIEESSSRRRASRRVTSCDGKRESGRRCEEPATCHKPGPGRRAWSEPKDDDQAVAARTPHPAHALVPDLLVRELDTDLSIGLASGEAAARLEQDGPNQLEHARSPAYGRIAARQLIEPLVGLLVAAALISAVIGETVEAAAIGLIVVLNAAFGFVQELGAERAVLALHASLESTASVIRDGGERDVPVRDLVTGDIVRIREGDRVPADARVLHTHGLEVDESLLTGESATVAKGSTEVAVATPLAERTSMVYAGTGVTRGSATAVVVATGARTEQGAIALLADEAEPPPTPLQARLGALARWMVVLGIGVTVVLGAAMLARGESLRDAFLVGVSVAVAAVPEGLAATVTIALALGSREMARRGAIVRTLSAIETIGEATVICTDKTGTLTENRLRLERREPATGREPDDLLWAAAAASAAEVDPVDRALVASFAELGRAEQIETMHSLPFEASRKRATVVVRHGDSALSVVKGAPEVVLARCVVDPTELERLHAVAERWAAAGVRVLAVASRVVDPDETSEEALELDLQPLGLVGLTDPLRPMAASSVRAAHELGLEVKMITGDHALTAAAIARDLGLAPENVHARFTPADKLELVVALQRAGEIVAVTGDGVNDAPALRQADVGIAMGASGTEAAREASSLVITDDDFATIVAAVEEGRRIAGNLRAFLAFLLSANLGEVLLFAVAIAAGLGPPLTVVQVLAVNLLTDGPPAIALARDPAGSHARLPRGTVFGRGYAAALVVMGLLVGLAALVAFLVVRELRPEAAQTAAFATVALAELALVFSCRSVRLPSWRLPPNRHLHRAVAFSLAVVAALVYLPPLQESMGTVSLTPGEVALVVALAVAPAVLTEVAKAVRRRR